MVAFLWLISNENTLDQYGCRSEVSGVLYGERVGICYIVGATFVYVWIGCSFSRSLLVISKIEKKNRSRLEQIG